MTLKIETQDIQELRNALFAAYGQVIQEMGLRFGAGPSQIALCRRKWTLEGMLRQLDRGGEPPRVLQLVPRQGHATTGRMAA